MDTRLYESPHERRDHRRRDRREEREHPPVERTLHAPEPRRIVEPLLAPRRKRRDVGEHLVIPRKVRAPHRQSHQNRRKKQIV